MEYTIDQIIERYIELRNEKSAIKKKMDDAIGAIEEKMEALEAALKAKAAELGVDSFKTAKGTAFLTTEVRTSVADWNAVLDFIIRNGRYDLLNKAVNKTVVKEFVETNKVAPPGVNFTQSVGINVRKPTNKAEDLGE